MVFNPTLTTDTAFNQPVQTPNAMEAVAGLFNFGTKVLTKEREDRAAGIPKLTEDEKFAVTWHNYVAENVGGRPVTRSDIRKFILQNPQFNTQAMSLGENQGVVMKPPEEVAIDSTVDWFKTDEGIVAVNKSQALPEEEREAFIMSEAAKVKYQEAEIAKLERDVKQLELEGTLDQKRWDVLKPTSKSFVDNTVETILGPIFEQVKNGVNVSIDPGLQAQLDISYDTITLENINAVLADTKRALKRSLNSKYADNFGKNILPNTEWNSEVFASLDSLIKIGEAFDTPQEQFEVRNSLMKNKVYERLDANGAGLFVAMSNMLPPEVTNNLISKGLDFLPGIAAAIGTPDSVLGRTEIATKVGDMSKSEADDLAKQSLEFLDKGYIPEVFTLFNKSTERAGYEAIDETSFQAIISSNYQEILKHTSADPEARQEMADFLTSDINKTITIIERNIPTDWDLVLNSKGQFSLVYTGKGPLVKSGRAIGPTPTREQFIEEERKKVLAGMPAGMSLSTVNTKLATLDILGDLGKEVQEAVGISNTDPKEKTSSSPSSRGIPKGRGRGRGRNVGAELGIDFEGIEAETGLPKGFLNTMAIIESNGNPSAQNDSSSAGGLFQQIDSNAAAYGVENRFDPLQSTEGAVKFAMDNTVYLASRLGREPTGGELYLAHQQGPVGAARLLANPDTLAVDIVGADAVRLNGGSLDMTAQEFANIWINKYDRINSGGVGPAGAPVDSLPQSAQGASPTLSLDSSAREVAQSAQGPSTVSTEALQGTLLSFESPEVQQIVEKATSAPEEAIAMAKEILTKPIDPSIKALIEALVKIGERV